MPLDAPGSPASSTVTSEPIMLHFLTQYLGPKTIGQTQMMKTACGLTAVVKEGTKEGQTLRTGGEDARTCPGCAEAMNVARLRAIRLRQEREREMSAFADKDDWRSNASDDESLGEAKSTDGIGPAESNDGIGEIEDTGP